MLTCADIGCSNPVRQTGKRATYSNKRFCSDACRARTSRLTRLQTKLKNLGLPLTLRCVKCGESIVRESEAQRQCNPKRETASPVCRAEAAHKAAENEARSIANREFFDGYGVRNYRITCADPMCGKEANFPVLRGKRRRYCTEKCWKRVYQSRTGAVAKESGK
ncbi:hypothetical protein ROS62_04960 [Streptomyces sp. DSM 41972]|uniref:Uncharacterized protein n=1 Tax=Streptomyces althioticus subsp. attaecolombicae TaxID=3075534 RepID=A0ABU3HVH3_9ACTN|nr:hypothetical protein [Streptomyces sp. DSM 41972]SCD74923.1 hypothetical protein GA0115238_122821 [Streptomyces sp. di50b]SCD85129.1 hypothetical protein GA0115245_114721 [Streptomyces sp. di188]